MDVEQLHTLFDLSVFKGGEVMSRPIALNAIIHFTLTTSKFSFTHEVNTRDGLFLVCELLGMFRSLFSCCKMET